METPRQYIRTSRTEMAQLHARVFLSYKLQYLIHLLQAFYVIFQINIQMISYFERVDLKCGDF